MPNSRPSSDPLSGTPSSADQWFTPVRFALLLAALILAMFPDILLGGRTFIFRDFGLFGYPLASYHRQSFWRGEIPLWNPMSHCGIPFLAQWNTLVLYPGSLIYLLLPLDWSLGLFNLAHLFLCGMSMYALAFSWTNNRFAATVAGLAYAFNGFTLNCLMWPNYIASLAWMPLVVLAAEKTWRTGGGRRISLAAFVGAMQMLSGTPEIILLTWLVVGGLCVLDLVQARADEMAAQSDLPARAKIIKRLAIVVALIAGLAAAQLLPFLDLLQHSQRDAGFAKDDWAMPLAGWINFLVPLFHTAPSAAGVHFQPEQAVTSSYYLGISVAALALLAGWRVPDRRAKPLWTMTAICLVLALGRSAGVYALLLSIFPPAGFMRYPIKFVMLPVMLAPLLAALAVTSYLNCTSELKRKFWRDGLGVGIGFLVIISLAIAISHSHPVPDEAWKTTALNGLTRVGFLAGLLGLWFCTGKLLSPKSQLLSRLAVAVLMWFDVSTHAPRQNPSVDRAVFQPCFSPLADLSPRPALGQSRALLSLESIMQHHEKILTNAADNYLLRRFGLYANVNLLEDIPKVDGFFALELREEREVRHELYPTTNSYRAPLADMLSVSQVTSATNLFAWTPRPECLPMATAGQQPVFLDKPNTLAALTGSDFNPRNTVILPIEDKSLVSATKGSAARILSSQWSAHRIALEVENTEPALVVLSQAFYHNWRAYIGHQPARLLRANHAFEAVEVPAGRGRQQITLVYQDRAFQVGSAISLASMLACVFFCARPGRSKPGAEEVGPKGITPAFSAAGR